MRHMTFSSHFPIWFLVVFGDQVTKILNNVYSLFLLSKAKQAKTEHMEMKKLQPIFWYFGSFDEKRTYEKM